MKTYPLWLARYSNEDIVRASTLADQLSDADRAAGRPATAVGYSRARYEEAREIVGRAEMPGGAPVRYAL